MKSKKLLSTLLVATCMLTVTFASAQSSITVKSSNKTTSFSSGSVNVKSSSKSVSKPVNGLTVSNGSKKVTITAKETTGYVTANALNVRSGPGTSYSVLGSIYKDAKVTIVESTNGWYKIKYGSGYGYVSADYISTTGTPPTPTPPPVTPTGAIKKVVLDPGHGGSDPGAVGPTGVKEKDVVLSVSKKVRDILKSKGIQVVMTRDTDKYLSLEERVSIANRTDADFFLSVHANSFSSQSANGIETFSYQPTGKGADISKIIQSKLVSSLKLTNRGHKTANFYVIKNTKMAASLTELAFISNPKEESLLKSDSFQTKAAQAIADAIMSYK